MPCQSLSGHQSAVESIVFDPAEKKVVAGSKSGSIKAFDLEAAKVSRTLKGHMSTCTALDYHLYGDYVASGSLDTIVKVWDLRTKSVMQTFKGHATDVTALCFTPDGRWLTSGSADGSIKIWDLTSGKMLHEFADHGGAITSLEFNPEEFILVSSSSDRTIRIWDVQEFALSGVSPVDNATVRWRRAVGCEVRPTNSDVAVRRRRRCATRSLSRIRESTCCAALRKPFAFGRTRRPLRFAAGLLVVEFVDYL